MNKNHDKIKYKPINMAKIKEKFLIIPSVGEDVLYPHNGILYNKKINYYISNNMDVSQLRQVKMSDKKRSIHCMMSTV